MPLSPEVQKLLTAKEPTKQITDLMQRCKGLVKMSRSVMKDYYTQWDMNDLIYRGDRRPDESDRKALKRNEPSKVYVPLTHSQVQTFVSFATMMLTSRDTLYELTGSGVEDIVPAKLAQQVIERDINYNKMKGVLMPQYLTDVARFGIGIFKSQWKRETVPVAVQVPDPKFVPVPGLPTQGQVPTITQYQPKTRYLGNMIEVISPYRWFPDTRLPLTRFRDGEFCADENEYSYGQLMKMQADGEVAGVDEIPKLPDDTFADRRLTALTTGNNMGFNPSMSPKDAARYCIITEVELKCIPSELELGDGIFLNKDLDMEVPVIIWIGNDNRIIRIVDGGYDHCDFLYDAAQFFNDQNRVINYGIAELLGPMQDVMDWLMNSRVTNVRKVMQNQLVVDPRFVEMQDLKDRNPVIRLKSTVESMSIDTYIKQLQVTDVTGGHINDMAVVKDFSEDATGMTENLIGQYSQGRRSAREASNVNSNAAARVVMPIKGLWEMAFLPLGKKLLSNIQQGLDLPQLVSIIGVQRFMENQQAVQQLLPVDKTMIVGNFDFQVFDATLPSQRMAIAAAEQEILTALSQNPELVFALGYDPKLILEDWFENMGIKNAERFRLTPDRTQFLMQLAGAARNQGGLATTQPGGATRPANGQSQPNVGSVHQVPGRPNGQPVAGPPNRGVQRAPTPVGTS